ncbi:MAG TPA: hypothetical protein DCM64_04530, partial [Gammaproteobacteria bacterium]|nr:hypothetical protein [Gammaproteobacteria bacterium]
MAWWLLLLTVQQKGNREFTTRDSYYKCVARPKNSLFQCTVRFMLVITQAEFLTMVRATLFVLCCLASSVALAAEPNGDFVSASSTEEIQSRQRLLPDDDIWWTVTGEQMGWMHRNVHQLFP